MQKTNSETREKLIEIAGALFAKHGYSGVSTRMIADAAKVNLGGIHYHFGGKLSLYVEAFRYAIKSEKYITIKDICQAHPELMETPAGHAEILKQKILGVFSHILNEQYPWKGELIVQEVCHPSEAQSLLAEKVFRPAMADMIEFCRVIKPDISLFDVFFISHMPATQVVFYLLTKGHAQEDFFGSVPIDREFFEKVAKRIASMIIRYLELPLPDDLKKEVS